MWGASPVGGGGGEAYHVGGGAGSSGTPCTSAHASPATSVGSACGAGPRAGGGGGSSAATAAAAGVGGSVAAAAFIRRMEATREGCSAAREALRLLWVTFLRNDNDVAAAAAAAAADPAVDGFPGSAVGAPPPAASPRAIFDEDDGAVGDEADGGGFTCGSDVGGVP